MPVGIAPQKQRDKAEDRGKNGSLAGSFAASVSSSVGVYSKTSRSAHSFRLREPGAGPVRPPSRKMRIVASLNIRLQGRSVSLRDILNIKENSPCAVAAG